MPSSTQAVVGIAAVTSGDAKVQDEELMVTWRNVQERVRKMAGDNGTSIELKGNINVDQIIQAIDTAQTSGQPSEQKSKVKKAVGRTLEVIQKVGGAIALGASTVFEPAEACFCALSIVIEAWQSYSGMLESLADVLERCTNFLDRFSNYTKMHMDIKLRRVASQQLELFIEICEYMMQLKKSKRSRLAAMAKTVFLNEDGVQELLDKMQNLNDKELGLVASQTLLGVDNVKQGVDKVKDGVAKVKDGVAEIKDGVANIHSGLGNVSKKLEEANEIQIKDKEETKRKNDEKRWRRTVLHTLEFRDGDPDDDRYPERTWEKTFFRLKKETTDGTGDWLETNSEFINWARGDFGDQSKLVLFLEGDDGSGKSQLAANAVFRLQQGIDQHRSAIAYYFLETDSKGSSQTVTDIALTVSCYLLWQLADKYQPFLKSAAAISEENNKILRKPTDMWQKLLIENPDRPSMDSTFFIILDGLNENSYSEFLAPLLRQLKPTHRTKILLTGKRSARAKLEEEKVSFDHITLGEVNISDMKYYINWRMDQMDMLRDIARTEIQEMREKILGVLTESTGGNYRKIRRVLDNISRTDEVEEINGYLKDAGNTAADQIAIDIARLEQTSTAKEIAVINELVLWTISAYVWMTPLQLEAALAIKALTSLATAPTTGDSVTAVPTTLSSLESKIRKGRYPFLHMDDDLHPPKVTFKQVDLDVAMARIPKKQDAVMDADLSSAMEIQEVEVNIIKHYLSTVCPPDVYLKFRFDQFFEQKLARKSKLIYQDPNNAHLTLALRCVKCLLEPRTDKTKELHAYASDYLYWHMYSAEWESVTENDTTTELDGRLQLADRQLRAQIGPLIVRLFTEEHGVSSLFGFGHASQLYPGQRNAFEAQGLGIAMRDWVFGKRGIEVLVKYFKDRAVLENIKDSQFVKDINQSGSNALAIALNTAIRAAANYLAQPDTATSAAHDRDIGHAFLFLLSVKTKMDNPQLGYEEMYNRDTPAKDIWTPSLERIESVEKWARELASIDANSIWWESHMVIVLYQLHIHAEAQVSKKDVESRARNVLEKDPENWQTSLTLGRVLGADDESITILNATIDRLLKDETWHSSLDNKRWLAEAYLTLGDKYWGTGDDDEAKPVKPDHAIAKYTQSLDEYTGYHDRLLKVLYRYQKQELWSEIVSLLEKLRDNPTSYVGLEQGKSTDFEQISNSIAVSWEDFDMNSLAKAAKTTDSWGLFIDVYNAAIKTSPLLWWTLRHKFYYGEALRVMKDPDEGFKVWEAFLEELLGNEKDSDVCEEFMSAYFLDPVLPELTKRALVSEFSATSRKPMSKSPQEYSALIEKLYGRYTGWQSKYSKPEQGLRFSRFYVLSGNIEKAKEAAREQVKVALEMIDNDDPSDDWQAFIYLNHIFSTFGDIPNARAATIMSAVARNAEVNEYNDKMKKYEADKAVWDARHGVVKAIGVENDIVAKDNTHPIHEVDAQDKVDKSEQKQEDSSTVVVEQDGVQVKVEDAGRNQGDDAAAVVEEQGTQSVHDEAQAKAEELEPGQEDSTAATTVVAAIASVPLAESTSIVVVQEPAAPDTSPQTTEEQDSKPKENEAQESETSPTQDDAQTTADEKPTPPIEPWDSLAYCDGDCEPRTKWVWPSSYWNCMDHIGNVQFCNPCYNKLKSGELNNGRCDKDHQHWYNPDNPDVEKMVKDIPSGSVLIEGEGYIKLAEWKRRITKEYLGEDVCDHKANEKQPEDSELAAMPDEDKQGAEQEEEDATAKNSKGAEGVDVQVVEVQAEA